MFGLCQLQHPEWIPKLACVLVSVSERPTGNAGLTVDGAAWTGDRVLHAGGHELRVEVSKAGFSKSRTLSVPSQISHCFKCLHSSDLVSLALDDSLHYVATRKFFVDA